MKFKSEVGGKVKESGKPDQKIWKSGNEGWKSSKIIFEKNCRDWFWEVGERSQTFFLCSDFIL